MYFQKCNLQKADVYISLNSAYFRNPMRSIIALTNVKSYSLYIGRKSQNSIQNSRCMNPSAIIDLLK